MSTALTFPRIVILPGWIYQAVLRNKLNIIDTTSYSKIRPFLSCEDLAEIAYLNNTFQLDGVRLSNSDITDILGLNGPLSESQGSELRRTILPLSGSIETAAGVSAKLTAVNYIVDAPYKFIRIDNTLFVILNEGFLSTFTNAELKLDFVKAYLKECYAMFSIPEVSRLDMFSLYLRLLK